MPQAFPVPRKHDCNLGRARPHIGAAGLAQSRVSPTHPTLRLQAQTVANFYLAFELDLAVVPVINKVDLPAADAARVAGEVEAAFDLPAAGAVRCSAKSGLGVADVLAAVVERMPAPTGRADAPFRLLLFDAHADEYRGVVCLVFVRDGVVRKGDRLRSCSTGSMYDVLEVRPIRAFARCPSLGRSGHGSA